MLADVMIAGPDGPVFNSICFPTLFGFCSVHKWILSSCVIYKNGFVGENTKKGQGNGEKRKTHFLEGNSRIDHKFTKNANVASWGAVIRASI